ncbi:uncharacterized protein STEHIDRAFT_165158 [Stereum hirsutum FP-91666 SS1]|uniref:uncharacterized protein n=1 Tax=Stereum hirsutum (strain FP-91666) TaxID=721885 RepID=UPI000440B686|nr:uncharacterized protein STEHIDRAFT_165158 [Stereum hirsutum FP-91666 SS1]EIM90562.1 hypothetical protein STEHIDRAFT_165158 [Stereum hirsutum FP-91666 SS1]
MAPVSIPSIAPAEPFSRTSGNVGPGAVWTVFNVNDEGSSVDSVDWGLWKDKALKWLSGAWTFAGEHAGDWLKAVEAFVKENGLAIGITFLVVVLLLAPPFRALIASIFSAIYRLVVFILWLPVNLLRGIWAVMKYVLKGFFNCLGCGMRGIRGGSLASAHQSRNYGGVTPGGSAFSRAQSFGARGGFPLDYVAGDVSDAVKTFAKKSLCLILMFLVLVLVVLLLLISQVRALVSSIFSVIFKVIVFILNILLEVIWIILKFHSASPSLLVCDSVLIDPPAITLATPQVSTMPPWFVVSTAKTSVERRIAEIINCFSTSSLRHFTAELSNHSQPFIDLALALVQAIDYPYTTGLLLLYFGAEPLLFCFLKGIFVIWGSFLYLFGFEKPRVNRDGLMSQSQRNYGATVSDTQENSSYFAYLEAAGCGESMFWVGNGDGGEGSNLTVRSLDRGSQWKRWDMFKCLTPRSDRCEKVHTGSH